MNKISLVDYLSCDTYSTKYLRYQQLRVWLQQRNVQHSYVWYDDGLYYPLAIVIQDDQDCVAFKLAHNLCL